MPHPFAYSPDGAHLVSAEGSELLVYDGPSEGPRWRKTLPGPVLAVGAAEGMVVSLDALGTLTRWRAAGEGDPIEAVEVGAIPEGLAVSPDGACAVWSDEGLLLSEPGQAPRTTALTGIRAAGFGPDRTIAVGFDDGAVRVLSVLNGEPIRPVARVESAVTGIAFSRLGAWFVAAGNAVFKIEGGEPAQLYRRYSEEKFESLTCSADGSLAACRLAGKKVVVLSLATHELAAVVQYFERQVGDLAFGPWPWLGVGLDLGDGNKIDLESGDVHRTDEHPGRPHNRWMLQPDVKEGVAARARRKAAGIPDPEQAASRPAPVAAPSPPPSSQPAVDGGINWHWVLGGLGILIALIRLLSGH